MIRFCLVCFAWIAATGAHAQDNVTDFTLDNGMQVIVVEDHRAPVVVHMVWYKVGSADEQAGRSGIAHFLEHLMFKATDNMEAGELSRTVTANGGQDNAFTSFDYTAYFQRVASDRLELMMQMEADRMVNLALVPEDIATERDVVIEERSQRTDSNPGALFREQRQAAQYMNHRYGVPIIGWRHELENLTLEYANEFYKEFYAPNNAILVVAGDVSPDEVKVLAETHYGVLPPNPDLKPRVRSQEPRQLSERRITFHDERVAQPYITRTYLAPERDSGAQEKAAALVYLAELLGGEGATSILGNALQFETQTAVYTSAFYGGMSLDDTTFGFVVVPVQGVSLQEAEDALDAEIKKFIASDIDLDFFERIKMQIRANAIYEQDDVRGIGQTYGAGLSQGLTVEDIRAWPTILQAVEPEDVIAVAKEVLVKNNAVTGWLMAPEQGDAQ